MLIKITLAEIKQEAKNYKKENPNTKHSEALNIIAQRYGFEKYEILKAKADKDSCGAIDINLANPEEMPILPVLRSQGIALPISLSDTTSLEDVSMCLLSEIEILIKKANSSNSMEDFLNSISELRFEIQPNLLREGRVELFFHNKKSISRKLKELKATNTSNENTIASDILTWLYNPKEVLYKPIFKFSQASLKNKKLAIIGGAGTGKSIALLQLQKHLDKKSTLIIGNDKNCTLGGNPHPIEVKRYEELFNEKYPIYKKATFKTFDSKIDFSKFDTILIDEVNIDSKFSKTIKDLMLDESKTIIVTSQTKEAVKEFSDSLSFTEELREFSMEKYNKKARKY